MPNVLPYRVKSISELYQMRGLPKPEHPLISVIDIEPAGPRSTEPVSLVTDFYIIGLKKNYGTQVKLKYGHQQYDYEEGIMTFMSPGQVFVVEYEPESEDKLCGQVLFVHPDFLWNTPLAKKIRQYDFFHYAVNEALFLSGKEEMAITQILDNIKREYHSNIDKYSQNIIIAQLESLLSYAERFYGRQFITRNITNHGILHRLEALLTAHFMHDESDRVTLPSVSHIAQKLNLSADYLSGLLKELTGLNAQQHIHQKLIEKAKEKLSTTDMSVGEIAYQLGFEHPQSFTKLFKAKTKLSPLRFRQTFSQ